VEAGAVSSNDTLFLGTLQFECDFALESLCLQAFADISEQLLQIKTSCANGQPAALYSVEVQKVVYESGLEPHIVKNDLKVLAEPLRQPAATGILAGKKKNGIQRTAQFMGEGC
jgi:hypothetical protein